MKVLIGADVGGTSSKVCITDLLGALVGFAVAPGANPRSSTGSPVDNLSAALLSAVAQCSSRDDLEVAGAVFAMAGAGESGQAAATAIVEQAFTRAGLAGSPTVCTDLDAAFAAGSATGNGLLVLIGTGAVCARYQDFRLIQRADGLGWLLGDDGSASWFGIAALRAVAADLDGRGPATSLTAAVLAHFESTDQDPRQQLVRWTYERPPAAWAALAPLVFQAAEAGDPLSLALVQDGLTGIGRTIDALQPSRDDGSVRAESIVLAGTLATTPGPLSAGVHNLLADRSAVAICLVEHPVVGAVGLAAASAGHGWSGQTREQLAAAISADGQRAPTSIPRRLHTATTSRRLKGQSVPRSAPLEPAQPSILIRIRGALPGLRPAEQRVAQAILADPAGISESSITAVATMCSTSETTVLRFCRAIGLQRYPELRIALARAAQSEETEHAAGAHLSGEISKTDSLEDVVAKITQSDARAIEDSAATLDIAALRQAVRAVAKATRIDIYGVGASGFVALDLHQKLHRVGLLAFVWLDPHSALTSAALLGKKDVAVGISHTGSTIDTIDPLQLAKSRGATTIAITNFGDSPITRAADHVLTTAARETTFRSGAMSSRIAQLAIVDCLFAAVAQQFYDRAVAALDTTYQVMQKRRVEGRRPREL